MRCTDRSLVVQDGPDPGPDGGVAWPTTTEPAPRTLSTEELAREAGVTPERVQRLLDAGAIVASPDGTHDIASIARVRLAVALTDGGIELDDLMGVIRSGALNLDWVARLWSVAQPTGRTFGEFAGTLGERAGLLPSIYAAFGLAVPPAQTRHAPGRGDGDRGLHRPVGDGRRPARDLPSGRSDRR